MYEVLDTGSPAKFTDMDGFNNNKFVTMGEAVEYAVRWLGEIFGPAAKGKLSLYNRHYYCGNSYIEIKRIPECPLKDFCQKHDYRHGGEAEELRKGIERLIETAEEVKFESASSRFYELKMVNVAELQDLLDQVDARDSLAFVEMMKEEDKTDD